MSRKKASKKAAAKKPVATEEEVAPEVEEEADEAAPARGYHVKPGRSITCSNRIIGAGGEVMLRDLNDDLELAQSAMDQLVERGLVTRA